MSDVLAPFTLVEMEPDCNCFRSVLFPTTPLEMQGYLNDVKADSRLGVIPGQDRVSRSSHCAEHGRPTDEG